MNCTRRESLFAIAGLGAASLLAPSAVATAAGGEAAGAVGPHVAPGAHQPVPLPFDPKRLAGLSEKLLVSHHDNNYAFSLQHSPSR